MDQTRRIEPNAKVYPHHFHSIDSAITTISFTKTRLDRLSFLLLESLSLDEPISGPAGCQARTMSQLGTTASQVVTNAKDSVLARHIDRCTRTSPPSTTTKNSIQVFRLIWVDTWRSHWVAI